MADFLLTAPANEATLMSTELNALSAGDVKNGSTTLDNTTNRHMLCDLWLDLGAAIDLSAKINPAVAVYLIPSWDGGTTYADGGDETGDTIEGHAPLALLKFTSKSGSRYAMEAMCPLGPHKYKATVKLDGMDLNATGNLLKIKTYTPTDT